MDIALVRKISQKLCATEIISFANEIFIVFDKKESIIDSELLADMIFKFRMKCSIDVSGKPMIKFSKEKTCRENFEVMKEFLLTANKYKEKQEKSHK